MTDSQHTKSLDIEALYSRYASLVLRRAMKFFGPERAEEIVHEVFMKLLEKPESFRGESSPVTWLYRVTTNHCLNHIRNEGRRQEILRENSDELSPSRARVEKTEAKVFLSQLWRHVPEELLVIGVYHYVDELTLNEIARIQACSPRTIVNRLSELKTKMAAAVGETT